MPVSDDFLNYVLERLGVGIDVEARRMFGGAGIYSEGACFALVADDTLYLKVDDSNRADFERAGSAAFSPFGTYSMSYYEIPADVLDDDSKLAAWTGRALAAARAGGEKGLGRGTGKKGRKR